MTGDWKDRFKDGIADRERALAQPRKISSQDFAHYKRHVLELYERLCTKVTDIPQIEVTRPIVTRSDRCRVDVQGMIETVHALVLRFQDRRLELLPEGLNLEQSRGRVRLRHNGKQLSRFLYATLEPRDQDAEAQESEWYLLDKEKPPRSSERLQRLEDELLEEILEKVFLS